MPWDDELSGLRDEVLSRSVAQRSLKVVMPAS